MNRKFFANIPDKNGQIAERKLVKKIESSEKVHKRRRVPEINLKEVTLTLIELTTFVMLLFVYVIGKVVLNISNTRFFPKKASQIFGPSFSNVYRRLVQVLDLNRKGTISRIALIDLSIRNMRAKKTRTFITIGGMSIGIAAIVFLVSIGYGLQQLVVSRVARLDEMNQADVTAQPGSKLKINDKTIADVSQTAHVEMTLPLIAVVGRVNFQNSISDMAVYGVTSDYLKQSAVKPVQGEIFESNDLVVKALETPGEVAGISTTSLALQESKSEDTIQDVEFTILPDEWIRVREEPSVDANMLGYTRRVEGIQSGEEVEGSEYETYGIVENGPSEKKAPISANKWIKAPVLLWEKAQCEPEEECEGDGYKKRLGEDGTQLQTIGYFAEINVNVRNTSTKESDVLGISSDDVLATDSALIDFVEIASESGIVKPPETKKVILSANSLKQALVNRSMLKILGIKENEAVGKEFDVSFVVTGELVDTPDEKIESEPTEYTIVGVTPDEKTPVFYVPFVDLRSLGITNFSQMKVVTDKQDSLPDVRKQIEALGFSTRSVADTVSQINSLFTSARLVLALLGMVALGVASLGMFNTMTVSLLERTREVGLLKAMGMKSSEVKELFLTESMLMGFFGGVLGLVIGVLAGKLLGLFISVFAVFKGVGYIDISYIPPVFVIVILVLSLVVGLVTGIYPARRATRISALNALRYE